MNYASVAFVSLQRLDRTRERGAQDTNGLEN